MAIKVGEFLFAIGFGKPDTANLERASKSAQRAIFEAQRAVAEGAEDAADKIEAASKAVAKHGRESKKHLVGWGHALEEVAKAAKKAAADYTAAWRDPAKLTEQWGDALGRARKLAVGLAGGAAAAAAGIGAVVHSTAESDAKRVKWAESLGMSARSLSELHGAAAVLGIESDDVNDSIKDLRVRIEELGNEGTGAALEAFRDLGIAVEDIQGKDAATQLGLIGDALAKVDPQLGLKAMDELLSDVGVRMIPMLKNGSAGLADLTAEAERLGLVVGDNAAEGSAALSRELGQVLAMAEALAADVARELGPEIRRIVGIAKEWVTQNREIIKAKIREFVEGLIPKLVELAGAIVSIVQTGASLVESLGGMSNAITIAATAFGALQVAALGIPGVILAASAALALGINELAGYRQEAEKLRKQTRGFDRSRSLMARAEAGELNDLTDEQFQAEIDATFKGAALEDFAQLREAANLAAKVRRQQQGIEERRTAAQERVEARAEAGEQARVKVIEAALRKRAKKKGLGEAAVQTALTVAKQALREGQDFTGAGELAATKLDSLTAKGAGVGAGKDKIDTRAADELFGADIRRMAERDGAGSAAVKASLEAAAESLKGGSTEGVARAAAYSRLGQATGREYKTGADGKDPLLSMILGKDVPDIEMGKLALGASPQVLQVTITNNIQVDAPITIPGAGSPSATGGAVADHLHGLFGGIAKAHKLAKVVFAR